MLRGCVLKNTKYAIGLVLYTGHESKIMLNSNKPRLKRSQVETQLNREIVNVWIVQFLFCLFCATYYVIWQSANYDNLNSYLFLHTTYGSIVNYIVTYGTWLIIFLNFVPISLVLTLDFVRLF
jgi:phospholipid-transporting ATPase